MRTVAMALVGAAAITATELVIEEAERGLVVLLVVGVLVGMFARRWRDVAALVLGGGGCAWGLMFVLDTVEPVPDGLLVVAVVAIDLGLGAGLSFLLRTRPSEGGAARREANARLASAAVADAPAPLNDERRLEVPGAYRLVDLGQEAPPWRVRVGDRMHDVQLDRYDGWTGVPRSFRLDGIRYRIGGRSPLGRRHAVTFTIDGQPAIMTRTIVPLRPREQLRRSLGGSLRNLPATALAYGLAGPGVGGGVAGASAVSSMLAWAIYSLAVAGEPRGSWVVSLVGGQPASWTFLPPGGPLPDGSGPW